MGFYVNPFDVWMESAWTEPSSGIGRVVKPLENHNYYRVLDSGMRRNTPVDVVNLFTYQAVLLVNLNLKISYQYKISKFHITGSLELKAYRCTLHTYYLYRLKLVACS